MNDILKKWGIDVPAADWYPEYLINNFSDKVYFIDKLPLTVSQENGYKLDFFDALFKEANKSRASRKKFLLTENKYINVLTKLWLYNQVFAGADIYTSEDLKKIDKRYVGSYKKFQLKLKQSGLVEIADKKDLDYFIRLGTRDIAQAAFYCAEYELIIVPSWSCFIVYFNNLSKFEIVKDIVTSEGMFLRALEAKNIMGKKQEEDSPGS